MAGRRQFGSVRRLPSGRWQARYPDDAGLLVAAPLTFRTRADAGRYLDQVRTDRDRGAWVDPRLGQVTLGTYATEWLRQRAELRPRTRELYQGLLRLHILPVLGGCELSKVTTSRVRGWYGDLLRADRPGASTVAKSYRLLRTILGTAVEDGLLVKNPCVVKGAGVERPAERPVATVQQVFELAEAIGPRWRAMVLLATFTGLRLGELQGLTRQRVDVLHGTVAVVEQTQLLSDGTLVTGPPKTEAGIRTVSIPEVLLPELQRHLVEYAARGPQGLVFCGPGGVPFRRASFYTAWARATRAVGIEGLRPHDLRHTGNTLAAATGASTKELMARMGHASPRAALIYQHATRDRDRAIASALSDLITGVAPAPRAPVLPLLRKADGSRSD
jgi:integrase